MMRRRARRLSEPYEEGFSFEAVRRGISSATIALELFQGYCLERFERIRVELKRVRSDLVQADAARRHCLERCEALEADNDRLGQLLRTELSKRRLLEEEVDELRFTAAAAEGIARYALEQYRLRDFPPETGRHFPEGQTRH